MTASQEPPGVGIRDEDLAAMRRALGLAASVRTRTSPNPWVGAVVVTSDGDWFEGATAPPGGPHAEVVALEAAGDRARGATLITTLEPCAHHGRTPPCTGAILAAGVARVVVGVLDPDPQVSGRGVEVLRVGGVSVDVGAGADEAAELLAPYLKHRRTGRPWVVLKLAATMDGRIAAPDGTARWLTGDAARADAHRLRALSDAVLVGAGTVRTDDPELTVRVGPLPEHQPLRVVLGQAPDGAKVHPALEVSGEPGAVLDELGAKGVLQVLIEGGARVAHAFHSSGLVDRYVVYFAPALFGGDDAVPMFSGPGAPSVEDLWRGRLVSVTQLGSDLRVELAPAEGAGAWRRGDDVTAFSAIEDAIEAIGNGEIVVVVDDEDRENEGDLIMAAEAVTPEKIAFFLAHTSGVICVPLLPERADELELPLMVSENTESQRTAFTVSVDYGHGTTTGISAEDRASTIHALIDPHTRPTELNRPGHIFPLRYRQGGVLKRAGHTEAAIDLVSAAGLYPAGVLCELVSTDKTRMARLPELEEFARAHGMRLITIADLIRYRSHKDKLVRCIAGPARIPTEFGDFAGYVYESEIDGEHHLAVVRGDVRGTSDVLVRVHSECLTGDAFGSLRCDCGPQLNEAVRLVAKEGTGVIVYLRGHEGRGIGLAHKLRAYNLQEQGHDTVDANLELGLPVDNREYGIGAQILVDLGVTTMRLMTNNPMKYGGLEGFGLDIVERVPLTLHSNPENIAYLRTKRERLGHFMEGLDDDVRDDKL